MSIDAKELRRLHEAATKGNWDADGIHVWMASALPDRQSLSEHLGEFGGGGSPTTGVANAALVAYLRNHVPDILSALEDRERLINALTAISGLGGNLSDERLTSRTGPNDARQRGLMYAHARGIARAAIDAARAAK